MDGSRFSSKAREAVETGKAARLERAVRHADAFREDLAHFDPRVLADFGESELKAFRQTLGLTALPAYKIAAAHDRPVNRSDPNTGAGGDHGWERLRRPEPSPALAALRSGVLAGLLVLGLGSLAVAQLIPPTL